MKIKTKFGMAIQILCILCLVGTTLFLLIFWNQIPAEVPSHYNMAGEADAMSGKGFLFFPLIMNWLMFLGISAVEHFPQMWNTGVKVTRQNRERVYRSLYHMIVCLKLSVVLTFSFLSVWHGASLPFWFFPASLALVFGPMLFFLIQLWRAR